jgi:molecular chaperone GrpE
MTSHDVATAPEEVQTQAAEEPTAAAAPETPPQPEPGAAPDADAEPAQLVALLEDARAKADDHWNQLLRARAEIENLHRRQARELENAHKFALDGFVRELLKVRDSLELGYEAAHTEGANLDKLREGTELTLKLMADTMAKFGVEAVSPEGQPFNPEFHQAMTLAPSDSVTPNTVLTVVQKGYLLNGRLVRPAMVIVSRAP